MLSSARDAGLQRFRVCAQNARRKLCKPHAREGRAHMTRRVAAYREAAWFPGSSRNEKGQAKGTTYPGTICFCVYRTVVCT